MSDNRQIFSIEIPRSLIQNAVDEDRVSIIVDGMRIFDIGIFSDAELQKIIGEEKKHHYMITFSEICGQECVVHDINGVVDDRTEICRLAPDHDGNHRFR